MPVPCIFRRGWRAGGYRWAGGWVRWWVCGWVGGCVGGWAGGCVYGWVGGCTCRCVYRWVGGCRRACVRGWVGGCERAGALVGVTALVTPNVIRVATRTLRAWDGRERVKMSERYYNDLKNSHIWPREIVSARGARHARTRRLARATGGAAVAPSPLPAPPRQFRRLAAAYAGVRKRWRKAVRSSSCTASATPSRAGWRSRACCGSARRTLGTSPPRRRSCPSRSTWVCG